MDKLGKIVKEAREKKGETLKDLAKHCKISLHFAKKVEYNKIVPISPRLVECIQHFYRIPRTKLERAARHRNKVGKAYHAAYRRKRAA